MATCDICGRWAGVFKRRHNDCKLGDKFIVPSVAAITRASLEATCDTLQALAKLLFPGFALAGGIGTAIGIGAHDIDLMAVCFVIGATAGVLAAALVYAWLKMQVLLARRISQHLG